jgi:hypothetical protein
VGDGFTGQLISAGELVVRKHHCMYSVSLDPRLVKPREGLLAYRIPPVRGTWCCLGIGVSYIVSKRGEGNLTLTCQNMEVGLRSNRRISNIRKFDPYRVESNMSLSDLIRHIRYIFNRI